MRAAILMGGMSSERAMLSGKGQSLLDGEEQVQRHCWTESQITLMHDPLLLVHQQGQPRQDVGLRA